MTEEVERKKPGPAPKPKVEFEDYQALLNRVEKLEAMISRFAALAGQRNLPMDYGLKPWDPTPKDMRKYA